MAATATTMYFVRIKWKWNPMMLLLLVLQWRQRQQRGGCRYRIESIKWILWIRISRAMTIMIMWYRLRLGMCTPPLRRRNHPPMWIFLCPHRDRPIISSRGGGQQLLRRPSSSNSPMKKNTTAVSVSSSKLNVSRSSVESNELFSTTTSLAERFQKLNWILNDNAAGPLPPPWNQHQCANNASNLNSNCQYKEEFCFEWRRGECHRFALESGNQWWYSFYCK